MTQCIFRTLNESNDENAIDYFIKELGSILHVDRTFIAEYDSENNVVSNLHEWCNSGILSKMPGILSITTNMITELKSDFENNTVYICNDTSKLEGNLKKYFDEQNIFSTVFIPVVSNNKILGYMGFDGCRKKRIWNTDELHCLLIASNILSLLITRCYKSQYLELYDHALAEVFDNLYEYIYVTDLSSYELLYANKALIGSPGHNKIGKPCYEVLYGRSKPCDFCKLHRLYKEDKIISNSYSWEYYEPDENRYFSVFDTVIDWPNGHKAHLCSRSDITEFKQQHLRLEQAWLTDNITDMPNRIAGIRKIEKLCRNNNNFYCGLLDISDFANFNRMFGSEAGDLLLQQVGRFLSSFCDMNAYRWESDSYLLIIENPNECENILSIIKARFKKSWFIEDIEYICGCNIGIVSYPEFGNLEQQLTQSAELALMKAKESANDNVCFYNHYIGEEMQESRRIKERLEQALHSGNIEVHYQPIFNVKTGRLDEGEALMRLKDNDGSFIPPSKFIPIAEKSGLIVDAGYFLLNEVCKFIAKTDTEMRININLSVIQLMKDSLCSDVKSILKQNGIPPGKIGFEITESEVIHSFDKAQSVIEDLTSFGIEFSFDDFGSGYSGIAYLSKMSMHALKIDKSLIDSICDSEKTFQLVSMLIDIAHKFNMVVVAEGVENKNTVDVLSGIGCDYIQGFYYARPVPESEFINHYMQGSLT
ncbi:MAG: bifunctional diguanylate cyclase/phosphodiesterase [Bacillota bacterium]|nr:bifunctional diguanylate cyclase/phosphodiesterase [Bacillota bacterium]